VAELKVLGRAYSHAALCHFQQLFCIKIKANQNQTGDHVHVATMKDALLSEEVKIIKQSGLTDFFVILLQKNALRSVVINT
jgi:hypothetical protein